MSDRQAGALIEVQVTPEMIEAGASVLRLAGAGFCDGGAEAAEDVFVAMLEASGAFRHGELLLQPSWQTT